MKYLNSSFSVTLGSKEYAEGYERTFGEGATVKKKDCACQELKVGYRLNGVPICIKCGGVIGVLHVESGKK